MLENVRFYIEEEQNDALFAQQIAKLGHLYINDAFSCSHRAHASIDAICKYLPSYIGRAMQQELKALESVLQFPEKPVMAIIGGSKVSSKIELLHNLIKRVQYLVIGGGMANTFLKAQGIEIGYSFYEKDYTALATEILIAAGKTNCKIILPIDVVTTQEITPHCKFRTVSVHSIDINQKAADIGQQSINQISNLVDHCKTLLWNGPVGVFEVYPFDQGSIMLAKHIAHLTKSGKLISVAGGGDTLAALNRAKVELDFSYISTAGGAFLEWLEGKLLPGLIALNNAKHINASNG